MKEIRSSKKVERWGGTRERERCLREARRYLQDADAEDVVQEALLRAWRKSDAWIPPGGPLPWLLTITRNEALRELGRGRALPIELPDLGDDDPALARVALRIDLGEVLAGLGPEERRLLELRYGEGLSWRVVADRLGVPAGTARRRFHDVLVRLRAAIESESG